MGYSQCTVPCSSHSLFSNSIIVRVFCVMIDKVSKSWCTSHAVWLLTRNSQWATQSAAAHVWRARAGMVSCEGWQCVWRLAWHQLAVWSQRLSSHAKASITQIKGTGDSSNWEIRICSAMKTQQQQQTEGQEAAYQSILCHARLKFPIVEYEVTGVCVWCVHAFVGGNHSAFCKGVPCLSLHWLIAS